MLHTLAIENYRSLLNVVIPLGQLNVVTGPNGSGKSSLYRALRLLAETAQGGVISSLAREGGLQSTLWAGPETLSRRMRSGEVPIQGGPRKKPVRLKLGFSGDDFGYAITLGVPSESLSYFSLDPEIKQEVIWAGDTYRSVATLVERRGAVVRVRATRGWEIVSEGLAPFDSIFSQLADPARTPEIITMREMIRGWRFYDHFRTDRDAPARLPQLGTRTPVLHHDGHDLAAAVRTIIEIGDQESLARAVNDAFPGAKLSVEVQQDGRFSIQFRQKGLLRPLSAAELSDGTLRYLLLITALLTPRPPSLMVLNEPETSLHPDLIPALAQAIAQAARRTQIWVVSHSGRLVEELLSQPHAQEILLAEELGQTHIVGQELLDRPSWHWPAD